MKNCEAYQERMTAGLAGELSPEEEAELRAHLEKCPACRAEFEELSRTWKLTEAMLEATALDETLPDSNRAETRRAMSPRRRFSAVRALWKIAAMLVACAAVLCAVLFSAPDERRRVRLDVFQSAEEMRAGVAAAGKRVVPGGAAPESLSLAFGGFPEITEKEISAVAGFFRKNGIRLEPDEIRLRKESFEIRVSPPRMEKIRIFLRGRERGQALLPARRQ